MTEATSQSYEYAAVIDGRAAVILAAVLDKCLSNGETLRQALHRMRVSPAYQAATLRAQDELRATGARWLAADEAQRKSDGRTETRGSGDVLTSDAMTVKAAAVKLRRTESRVRQIARGGGLGAERIAGRWMLDRREVVAREAGARGRT